MSFKSFILNKRVGRTRNILFLDHILHIMKSVELIGWILVVVGAINWGLIGLGWLAGGADWNVVHMLLGSLGSQIEAIVYVLVGLSGVWMLVVKSKMM